MMNKAAHIFLHSLMAVSLLFANSGGAEAQRRNDRDIRDAVRSLNSKLDDFDAEIRFQMQNNSADAGQLDQVSDDVRHLQDSAKAFQDNFDRKRENRDDVNAIVNAAKQIDGFLQTNPQNRRVEDQWTAARSQIDRLASNYGITANWSSSEVEPGYP